MLRRAVLRSQYTKRVKAAIRAFLLTLHSIITKLQIFESALSTLHQFHTRHVLFHSVAESQAARTFVADKWADLTTQLEELRKEVIFTDATYVALGREFWGIERRDAEVREGMKKLFMKNRAMWVLFNDVGAMRANAGLGVV